MQIDVKLSLGGDSFEAKVDGKHAGRLDLVRRGAVIVYPHTVVDPEFEGRGVGSELVRVALDAARAEGVTIVPSCWFVKGWIERHPDYADLVEGP
ncbi:GNAT family N-acetyltransferase [Streptosporangium sp. CA-135522]|uniref:GNAT family N-acetyltransferase n=1 Tax=Streptosporangium sp. CA-135522 TaxID=3240072 RepID=UPI003D9509FA